MTYLCIQYQVCIISKKQTNTHYFVMPVFLYHVSQSIDSGIKLFTIRFKYLSS